MSILPTYYCDFDNGTDAAFGGTTTGDPYKTPDFAASDIWNNHGAGAYGDLLKCIGTHAPVASVDLTDTNYTNGGGSIQPFVMMSDGATAFGTHSWSTPAVLSGANCGGKYTSGTSTQDGLKFVGFKWTGFVDDVYMVEIDNYCGMYFNQAEVSVARPKVWSVHTAGYYHGNYVKATHSHATTSTNITYALGARFIGNVYDINGTGGGTGVACSSNQDAAIANNLFILEGSARAIGGAHQFVVANNDFVGRTKSSQVGFVLSHLGIACFNNHFENLSIGIQVQSTVRQRNPIIGNTYFNVDTPLNDTDAASPIWFINESPRLLSGSGFVDAPNNDFTPSAARQDVTSFDVDYGAGLQTLAGITLPMQTGLSSYAAGGGLLRNRMGM